MQVACTGVEVRDLELDLVCRGREPRTMLYYARPLLDERGHVRGSVGACLDITARKRAEEQLAGSSQRLREVAAASSTVHSATTTDSVLQIATDEARRIIGTHQSVSSLTISQRWAQAINARSLSDKYAQWRSYEAQPDGSGIYSLVCRTNKPLRLTQAELEAHPEFRRFGKEGGNHPPLRGWLAVPFVGRGGRNLGLIQLSDKLDGSDFTDEDEAILVQFATITSVAIANAALYEGLREADRCRRPSIRPRWSRSRAAKAWSAVPCRRAASWWRTITGMRPTASPSCCGWRATTSTRPTTASILSGLQERTAD
jgi:PAS domain-containing protein